MTSSGDPKPNYSRRFAWFAAAIAAAIALYAVGWHYAAGRLSETVTASVAAVNRDGRRASCENAEVRGFPFRIGVFCRSVMYEDARGGVAFRARQFRSAAQIYAPRHVIGELDGPATLAAPGIVALELDWSSLRASARLAQPLPQRLSVEAKNLAVRIDEPGDLAPLLWQAELFELHSRPVDADLDIAIRFGNLMLAPEVVGTNAIPALRGVVDFQLDDGTSFTLAGQGLRGHSGTLRNATVHVNDGDAGISASGPVSVDEAGLVNAQLELTFHEPAAVASILTQLFPDFAQEIALAGQAVASMGDNPVLPMRIANGEISLGIFSLGSIPPL